MKIVFFGCTKFSEEILRFLLKNNADIKAIFSAGEEFNISYSKEKVKNSNFSDLKPIAKKINIPFYEIDSVKGKKTKDYFDIIKKLKPDVILVLGWYYMVPKSIRLIPKYGAWGIHASLLPRYAGGAPLVWAILNGEKKSGVTLFKLESGVDDGDIISQKEFEILNTDTIKSVYKKATVISKKILKEALEEISNITFQKQDKSKIEIYSQRKPEDGEINFDWSSERIHNFIRGQTKPYPGAFFIIKNKKITIWDAKIEDL